MSRKNTRRFYRDSWKDHFTFTLRERRGFLILAFLISGEIGVLYYIRNFYRPIDTSSWSAMTRIADSVLREMNQADGEISFAERSLDQRGPDSLFRFDPNSCSHQEWIKLGLSDRQATTMLKYVSHGGRFRTKSDLEKIRVLPSGLLRKWMPFINLPDSIPNAVKSKESGRQWLLEINASDSSDFEKLRGVGPAMAGRIVRYRELLGGFLRCEQLLEVYGIRDSLFASFRTRLMCDSTYDIRSIGLNSTAKDSLRRHPYIGYKLANQIDRYRKQHRFGAMDELRQLPLVTDEIFRKLAPYLSLR